MLAHLGKNCANFKLQTSYSSLQFFPGIFLKNSCKIHSKISVLDTLI